MNELNPIPKQLLCSELIKMFLHADIHKVPVNMIYKVRQLNGYWEWEQRCVQVTDVYITQSLPTEKVPTSVSTSSFIYTHKLQTLEIDITGTIVMETDGIRNIENLEDYGDSWGLRFIV